MNNKKIPVGDINTDINKDDFTKNASTFAGTYAGIIQRLRSIAPDSRIFIVTDLGRKESTEREKYNSVIAL